MGDRAECQACADTGAKTPSAGAEFLIHRFSFKNSLALAVFELKCNHFLLFVILCFNPFFSFSLSLHLILKISIIHIYKRSQFLFYQLTAFCRFMWVILKSIPPYITATPDQTSPQVLSYQMVKMGQVRWQFVIFYTHKLCICCHIQLMYYIFLNTSRIV